MRQTPEVSVIIPAFQRTDWLRKAILSVFAQSLDPARYELIVVDSSLDDLNERMFAEVASQAPCRFRFVRLPDSRGPGISRNRGVRESAGRILAFMDSDCQAHQDWLRHSLDGFETGVGLVQGKTKPDPLGKMGVFTWYPHNESEYFVYECTNVLYLREAFERGGGFPAEMHAGRLRVVGGEDVTLAWKVKTLGWKSRFVNESIVYHEVVQVPRWRWFFEKRLFLWPSLVKAFPPIRQFLCLRYFWDRGQALLTPALLGIALSLISPWFALLATPYLIYRARPRSKSFPGLLRPLRALPYFLRDTIFFLTLLAGSIRYRSILL